MNIDTINKTKAYIKANEEMLDEYFEKIKKSEDEKEINQLLDLIKICKKSIIESKNKLKK